MSTNEDRTSPTFTAVRSASVLRKNERAIDKILRVLVIKTTVTEDDLEAVQNILDSNITIRRAGGSTEILSVASAFGRNDLFIRVYLAISSARVEPEALVMLTDPTRLRAVWDPSSWTGEVVAKSAAQNLVQIVYTSPSLSLAKAVALEEALQSGQRQGRPCPRVGTVPPPPLCVMSPQMRGSSLSSSSAAPAFAHSKVLLTADTGLPQRTELQANMDDTGGRVRVPHWAPWLPYLG